MKQFYLISISLLLCGLLHSQIKIDKFSLPKQGDQLMLKNQINPSIDVGVAGGPYTWDFSNVQGLNQNVDLEAPSAGTLNIPGADFAIINGPSERYYKANASNDLELIYFLTNDPIFDKYKVKSYFNDYQLYRKANLSFGNSFNDYSEYPAVIEAGILPDTLTGGIGFDVDSLRITSMYAQSSNVDAYGEVILPDATWDVLRVNTKNTRTISVAGYVFGTWIEIPNYLLKQLLGDQLGALLDTTVTYSFEYYSDKAIEPIAVVTSNNEDGSEPLNIQYKSGSQVTNTQSIYSTSPQVNVYPNPTFGDVEFDFQSAPYGLYKIKVINILGKEMWSKSFYNKNGQTKVTADLSNLQRGTYLYTIIDNNGQKITTKRLVIVNP